MSARLIKRPDRYPGMEVTEHTERDSGYLLASEFGMPEFADTEPPEPLQWALEEVKPSRIERVFGRRK